MSRHNRYLDATDPYSVADIHLTKPTHKERRVQRSQRRLARGSDPAAHGSVLYLMLRRHFPLVAVILVLMAIGELVLFGWRLSHMNTTGGEHPAIFARVLEASGVHEMFTVTALLLVILLGSFVGGKRGRGRVDYTLRRLRVSEAWVYRWHAVFTAISLMLLAFIQVLLIWGMGQWYTAVIGPLAPGGVGEGTLLLTFYHDKLWHSLLPLSDGTRWLSSILILVALSLGIAHMSFCQVRRRYPWLSICTVIAAFTLFPHNSGRWDWDVVVVLPLMLLFSVLILVRWAKGGDLDG